jgi:fructose-bisphosphate aldolase class II
MGVVDVLSRKSGVIVGDDVLNLFEYAQANQFAIPAIVSQFSSTWPDSKLRADSIPSNRT